MVLKIKITNEPSYGVYNMSNVCKNSFDYYYTVVLLKLKN